MNVNIGPYFEKWIRHKIETGRYTNASEVVRAALRAMEERDEKSALRAAIAVGERQAAAGELFEWTATTMAEIQAEADEEDRMADEATRSHAAA